jgi:hypothetical protein
MNVKVLIEITEKDKEKDVHDIDIEVEGIEVDDLPNLFDYLTPKITMRHHNPKFKRVDIKAVK